MKKLMLIVSVLCILICNLAKAQLLPMDNGVNAPVVAAYSDDTNYYALSGTVLFGGFDATFKVNVWNGVFWSSLPEFTTNSDTSINYINANIVKYKGELYIAGNFSSVNGISNSSGIIKWDGTKWTNVGAGLSFYLDYRITMSVYNNKLFVSGNYRNLLDIHLSKLFSWDGNSWTQLDDTSGKKGIKGRINYLLVDKGKLCVMGSNKIAGDSVYHSILTWNDTSWSNIKTPTRINTAYIGTLFNGNVYMFVNDTGYGIVPYTWDHVNWIMDTTFYKSYSMTGTSNYNYFQNISELKVFNNKVWLSGYFLNKVNKSYYPFVFEDKNNVLSCLNSSVGVSALTLYKKQLLVAGNFVNFENVNFNYVAAITHSSYVSGQAFIDYKSNCKPDSVQNVYGAYRLLVDNGKRYLSLDSLGYYNTFLDSGTHTFSLLPARYFKQSCPDPTYVFSKIMQPDSIYSGINFGCKPIPGVLDLKVTISSEQGYTFHPRIDNTYYINYENIGTSTVKNFRIFFDHPASLKKFTSSPSASNYNSPQADWEIDSLLPGEKRMITTTLSDSALGFGDSLQFIAWVDPMVTIKDTDKTNNADTLIQTGGHSWDPNEKQSFPFGDISENTKGIQYTIEFQNTGTAPAYQAVVIDTIDVNLPIDGITMIGSNHKYRMDINGNILRWTFENINLPDSSQDEPNSHGYISYSATIKNGLSAGTVIKNKAYIYFDYNAPVITNQTSNKLLHNTITSVQEFVSPGNNELEIFPNPAQSSITLKGFGFKPGRAELYCRDMLGRTVFSYSLQAANDGTLQNMIDISSLRQGIYQIEIWQGSFKQEKKLIILK